MTTSPRHLTALACGLALTTAACSSSSSAERGLCDRAALGRDLSATADLDAPRAGVAAAVAAEACTLPEPLERALVELTQSGDCIAAARGIADAPELLRKACPAGHDALGVLQRSGGDGGELARACELPRLGFASQDELARAPHWACTLVGSMVFVVLDEAGEPGAARLARMIVLD